MGLIVPAVLPKSRAELDRALDVFGRFRGIRRVQIDVVDGVFASPASWPYTAPGDHAALDASGQTLPYLDRIAYEMDLMTADAEATAEAWLSFGATRLTFHAESVLNLPRLLAALEAAYGREPGAATGLVTLGVALNITTPASLLDPVLERLDYVQFMGIAAIGRQGAPFDPRAVERVRAFHAAHPQLSIQVDGGVNATHAKELLAAGVSDLIVGSAILRAEDPAAEFAELEALFTPYGV